MSEAVQEEPIRAPLFSVLTATYDQAEYVVETLDTVAEQTCGDYEVVIVNDGSTDDTEARVAAWIQRFHRSHPDRRARLLSLPNAGQSAALESGFAECRGRYICLLDSDDRWLPHKLERVAELVREDPEAGMLMHPLLVIDAQGRRTGDVRPKRARLPQGDLREQVRRTSRHVAPATSGIVIRADVFRQLVPMPTKQFRTHADLYLTLGATLLAPVRSLEEPLGEYRMHPDGQHIRTMLSPEGLRRCVELQTVVARHFGIEAAADRNAYFVRHAFALAKLQDAPPEQLRTYSRLMRATWQDTAFGAREKVLFTGYWTACMLAPRGLFRRLWRSFQMKQTGFDRVGLAATRESGI